MYTREKGKHHGQVYIFIQVLYSRVPRMQGHLGRSYWWSSWLWGRLNSTLRYSSKLVDGKDKSKDHVWPCFQAKLPCILSIKNFILFILPQYEPNNPHRYSCCCHKTNGGQKKAEASDRRPRATDTFIYFWNMEGRLPFKLEENTGTKASALKSGRRLRFVTRRRQKY